MSTASVIKGREEAPLVEGLVLGLEGKDMAASTAASSGLQCRSSDACCLIQSQIKGGKIITRRVQQRQSQFELIVFKYRHLSSHPGSDN